MMTTITTSSLPSNGTTTTSIEDDGQQKQQHLDTILSSDDDDMPTSRRTSSPLFGSIETTTSLILVPSNGGTTTTTTSIHVYDDQQQLNTSKLNTTSGDDANNNNNMPPRPTSSPLGSVQSSNSTGGATAADTSRIRRRQSLHDPKKEANNNKFIQHNSPRSIRLLSCITYEQATWFIFIAITLVAIVDRFTTNVWPRQSFIIGAGTAGTDPLTLIPGPWSVMAYDIIARISGRHAICCFNLLLVTRCKSLEYFLANSTYINRHILDCSNITNANIRLHRWNAIGLCVLTIIHVWSILFPCFFHGYSAQVLVGTFEWPLSERKPKGFKDVNVATETMSLQVDDVWRLIEMTIMLGILTPISVRWLTRRWHIGMPLHQFIMIMYFVDIVRRHTHPHSIIFNTPFFIMWILDKIFQMYWKRCVKPAVHCIKLDEMYMVVLWNTNITNSDDTSTNTTTTSTATVMNADMVGPDYYLRLNDSSFLEGRHVFTTFENRLGLRLEEDIILDSNKNNKAAGIGGGSSDNAGSTSSSSSTSMKQSGKKKAASALLASTWTAATVIRVYNNKRKPRLGHKDPISHTQRIFQTSTTNQLDLNVWGPAPGEMSHHIKYALLTLLTTSGGAGAASPVVLVGAGSGIGYMLDALQYYYQSGAAACCMMEQSSTSLTTTLSSTASTAKRQNFAFKILFTTRSASLFRWVEQMVGKIVHRGDCGIMGDGDHENNNDPNKNNNKNRYAKIVLALTGTCTAAATKADDHDDLSQLVVDLEESITTDISPRIVLSQQFGRVDFYDEIPMGSTVFCQGGVDLKNSLKKTCRVKRSRWFFEQGGGS